MSREMSKKSKSTYKGDTIYRGTYVGCYWYDVKKFNQEISKNLKD